MVMCLFVLVMQHMCTGCILICTPPPNTHTLTQWHSMTAPHTPDHELHKQKRMDGYFFNPA